MLNSDITLKVTAQPEIPENTFFLEPQSYWQWKGQLAFSDSPEYIIYTRAGKTTLVVAIILLLPLLLTQGMVAFIFFGGFSLLSAGAAFWLFRNAQRQNQYQAFGKVILGELVSIQREFKSIPTANHPNSQLYKRGYYTTGQYRFKTPEGKTLISDFRVWRRDADYVIYNDKAETGTPVVVLYISPEKFQLC